MGTGIWLAAIAEDGYLVRATLLATAIAAGVLAGGLVLRRPVAIPAAVIVLVALNSGNIGTLIRHRGLALPYLIWLSVLGASEGLRRLTRHQALTDKETRHATS